MACLCYWVLRVARGGGGLKLEILPWTSGLLPVDTWNARDEGCCGWRRRGELAPV
jgi:hypothetical protein